MTMAADRQDKVLNFSSEREQSGACSSSAEREKNQGKKFLNVPNKREQSQTCLNSAERAGLRPKGNVPTLRFPEFRGEWAKYKISDMLDFYSTNSLSWDQLEYNSDELLNLHYGLIHVGLPTVVNLDENILPNIKKEFLPKNYELCREGDVAFADASEDTNEVAKAIEFVNLSDKNVVCGLHTIHGRDNHNLTSIGFKGYAFASESFHNQIRRIAQGTKIFSISSKNFTECYIGIPSKDEQTKIAELLALIDERISTQSRIIEDLKSLSDAICERLYTPSEKGSWQTYKYADLFSISNERNSKLQYKNVLSASQEYGMIERNELNIDIKFEASSITNYKIVRPNQYVIHLRSFQGGFAYSEKTGVCSPAYTILVPNEKLSTAFLKYYFTSKRFIDSLRIVTYGIRDGRSISVDEFLQLKVTIPAIAHQQHIVQVMQLWQEKIRTEEDYLSKLQQQKKFLLSSMFI